jgi:hypothetical protein
MTDHGFPQQAYSINNRNNPKVARRFRHTNTNHGLALKSVLRRLAYRGPEKISFRKRSQFCSLFRDELKKSLSLCSFDLSGEYFAETFDIKPRNHGVERDGIRGEIAHG